MKNNMTGKRLLSVMIAVVMMFTSVFPVFAEGEPLAESSETVIEQTAEMQTSGADEDTVQPEEQTGTEDSGISLLAGDITPPVINIVEQMNNGTVSGADRYLYVNVTGYDSDGSAFNPSESIMMFYVPNCMSQNSASGYGAESITDNGNGNYTFKFPVESSWYGPYTVVGLEISDEYR